MPNTLYFGDNLDILRNHIPAASIDLIYLDPPAAGRHASDPDSSANVEVDKKGQVKAVHEVWQWSSTTSTLYDGLKIKAEPRVAEIVTTLHALFGESAFMAYLVEMTARLIELHRVLNSSGCLFLQCDSGVSHYLRLILDTIFGPSNFRSEIIWQYPHPRLNATSTFANVFDSILLYSKSNNALFYGLVPASGVAHPSPHYTHDDNDGRGVYRLTDLASPYLRPNLAYEWRGYAPPAKGWRYSIEKMQQLHNEGKIYYPRWPNGTYDTSRRPALKQYLSERSKPVIPNVWTDIPFQLDSEIAEVKYPTQKPLALLERIIRVASQPGTICLDPFVGSGTTLVAAQLLGREWIGIDNSQLPLALAKMRLHSKFPDIALETIGEPRDLQAARQLASDCIDQFRWWIIGILAERTTRIVRSRAVKICRDGREIDCVLEFEEGQSKPPQRVAIQIKVGDMRVGDMREMLIHMEQEAATIGVIVTLEEPAHALVLEGKTNFPRIQILTVAAVLNGARIQIPHSLNDLVETNTAVSGSVARFANEVHTYLSTEQAAKVLGVSTVTIRVWCANNRLAGAVQHGRDWSIPVTSVENFVRPRRGRPTK